MKQSIVMMFCLKRILPFVVLTGLGACTAIHPPAPYLPSREGLSAGQSVTVGANENIYGVARAHNVSMRDLIVLNNLKPPFEIHPGQTLVLPASGASSFAGDMPPPASAPLAPVEKNELSPISPGAVSSETLAPIGAPAQAAPQGPPPQVAPAPHTLGAPQSMIAPSQNQNSSQNLAMTEPVQALNRPLVPSKQVVTTAASDAPVAASSALSSAASSNMSMIWPVQGPVVSGFGAKGPGLNNDGVNISAPKGAPVVAAAQGTVVYAGDEMKGFGNLVLIRHQGDWVSAYAHLDRVLVKKDSVVDQGDEIGTVGKTGNVGTPQLHFETRLNGKPVDPAGVVKSAG